MHNINKDLVINRIKALEVVLKYHSDVVQKAYSSVKATFEDVRPDSGAYHYIEKGCSLNLFDCSEGRFNPGMPISQRDFLDWFFKLRYFDQPDFLVTEYALIDDEYTRNWLHARWLNLLVDSEITYHNLQQLLFRDAVVKKNFDQPYRPGFAIDFKEINAENYHNIDEINSILHSLDWVFLTYKKDGSLNKRDVYYLDSLRKKYDEFSALRTNLVHRPYILQKRSEMDPEVTQLIRRYKLQDVLHSYSYDYSKNAAYRQYNLTTGVTKFHGKVFQPDEVINYWEVISDNDLNDFKYGWVIVEGKAQWQFGGGICGSSSMIFLPSWKSGLTILERRNHSQYFSDLYPMEYIGLDATLYRPSPNLRIQNNTNHPIVFNVIDDTENKMITVEIIGNQKYKNIEIEGPVYKTKSSVKWIRHLEEFDGKITSEALNSVYSIIQ